MAHTPHQLVEEFPDHAEAIARLKAADAHFAKLVETYNAVNQKVYMAESNVQPLEHLAEEQLRKERALVKDQIWSALSKEAV